MASFTRLIRFESKDGEALWADIIDQDVDVNSLQASTVTGYRSIEDVQQPGMKGQAAVIQKLLAPVPHPELPIYCVGLNYRSHANEASLPVPRNPPLWMKPANALANPGEAIPLNKFCAEALPDYEAELVFITSRECKDITESEAPAYILGYTAGNDISCRKHQMPEEQGGQFFYAKAFDKFAPLGPCLVHPSVYGDGQGVRLACSVNGEGLQDTAVIEDMINSPARILSYMSQGTTIPAGTGVMTGTPKGVGFFQKPRRQLNDGDEVRVSISGIGELRNRIVFV